jgi:predicted nucleic acid-binding protein
MTAPLVVVDASVAVKWVLPEAHGDDAEELAEQRNSGEVRLIAPRLIVVEVASAISKRCRRSQLTMSAGEEAFRLFEIGCPFLVDEAPHVRAALGLSVKHQMSFWDSIYLVLAMDSESDLVTADARFYRSASLHYGFVRMIG